MNGQIRVLAHAKVDTDPQEGIRNTFVEVPDAPISRFVLKLKGGPKMGLLENSENLCHKRQQAGARFGAHNGRSDKFMIPIANNCGSGARKH